MNSYSNLAAGPASDSRLSCQDHRVFLAYIAFNGFSKPTIDQLCQLTRLDKAVVLLCLDRLVVFWWIMDFDYGQVEVLA